MSDYARRGVVAVLAVRRRFLVIERAKTVIAPGKLCFPGGGIESGETPAEALVRECREELGVEVAPLREIWRNVTPWNVHLQWWTARFVPAANSLGASGVVANHGAVNGGDDANEFAIPEFSPNPAEVGAVYWMTPDEMRKHPGMLESNRPFLRELERLYPLDD